MRAILDAYAAGYNRFLEGHRRDFPAWATPITGVDVLAHARAVLLLDFALDRRLRLVAKPAGGSTMWAIGGRRSKSGHGMLLANPHVTWDGATLFHEVQLTVPGFVNVSGATLIGLPGVFIGFNEVLGWSQTVNRVDGDDVYELTLDSTRTRYAYDGRWLPLRSRTVSVTVRTPRGLETRRRTMWSSHYGPVLRMDQSRAYSVKSANLDLVNFLVQYNLMAKATSLRQFRSALQMQQIPMFNIGYADRSGNIWFVFNGRIPLRPDGFRWSESVPGNTSHTEWFVVRPLDDLPQLLNPMSGYIQNCNDAPWYTNLEQRIDPRAFPNVSVGEGLGWRSQMSIRLLRSEPETTLERLVQYKFDSEILVAARLKDELLALVASSDAPAFASAVGVLRAWDNRADSDSRGAMLFLRWWSHYEGVSSRRFRTDWSPGAPLDTPSGIAEPEKALEAFRLAVAGLTRHYGAVDVPWGQVHRLRRGDIDVPIGGAHDTLQEVLYREEADGMLVAVGGDSYILAVEFTEGGPRAFSVIVHSQSSNPRSRHFNDQSGLYARETLKPAWFSERDITANVDREYRPGH
jgi:acyl-homoserine-lactone acylase